MSYASVLLNSGTETLPDGAICVGETVHPRDIKAGSDPELSRLPVLRLANGTEVLWAIGTLRSLPRGWRSTPGAIDYQTDHLVTVAEAAEAIGVSERRVHALLADGRLAGARKMGRQWIIPRAAVEQFERRPEGRPRKVAPG